jgi:hypothetical protein
MDILEKLNSVIKNLERIRVKTVSREDIKKDIENLADVYLSLDCICADKKEVGKRLWDISQESKQQPRTKILNLLRIAKKNLSDYGVKQKLESLKFKKGKTIIFSEEQNYSAYDQLRIFFSSAKDKIYIIDPYLSPDTFKILQNVSKKVKISLLTNSKGFYNGSKVDFNRFKKEYAIEARHSDIIHDRFFVIDGDSYFSGSSLHGAGNKLSAITLMEKDDSIILIKKFEKIWVASKKIK